MRAQIRHADRVFAFSIPIGLAILDLVLRRRSMLDWSARQWLAWLLSLALACMSWAALIAVTRALSERCSKCGLGAVVLLASFGALWLGASFACLAEFGRYPTWSEVAFLLEESRNVAGTLGLLVPWLTLTVLGGIALVAATISALVIWLHARPRPRYRWKGWQLGLVASLAAISRAALGNADTPSPPDANFLVTASGLVHYYATRSKGDYEATERPKLPELAPSTREPLNVILIVQESLTRSRLSLYGHHLPTTPRLQAWAQKEPDALAVFERGLTNSGNTSVVLPLLLTGLPPSAGLEALHEAPFLWQFAAAAGYRTMLLSAQSFRYAAFDQYFLSAPPERVFTADGEGVELVNGGGMDDREFARHVNSEIDAALADPRPFFAVLQYNATHHPILELAPVSAEFAGGARTQRYDNAVALLDRLVDDLRRRLVEKGVLDRTLIVITSDHGENLGGHACHRTQSYYDEVLAIPLLVYLPERLRKQRPEAVEVLRSNRGRNVQNLDLPPTLLDALGLLDSPQIARYVAAMTGQSLFREVPEARVIYALNNTAARRWTNEGFSLVRGQEKYIFSEWRGHEYYDRARDPLEQRNLWSSSSRLPPWVAGAIGRAPAYRALLERHVRPNELSSLGLTRSR